MTLAKLQKAARFPQPISVGVVSCFTRRRGVVHVATASTRGIICLIADCDQREQSPTAYGADVVVCR
jgi:hypothetical protein